MSERIESAVRRMQKWSIKHATLIVIIAALLTLYESKYMDTPGSRRSKADFWFGVFLFVYAAFVFVAQRRSKKSEAAKLPAQPTQSGGEKE